MPHIRPVSDLRNNFADISRIVHETQEPVFLTKNGYGDMVVLSMEAYERKLFESEIYFKLKEAELEAKSTEKRLSHEEVFKELKARLSDKVESDEV
jgi:prevent-host-death family protein